MSAVALTTTKRAPAVQKADTPPRISARIRRVAELVTTGECKTVKAACERVGIHPDYAYRELKKPQVRVFIERRARETIAAGMMRASARLIDLVDASSEHVSADVSRHILAIGGIAPPDRSQPLVNIAISPGYVVKLRHAEPIAAHEARAPDQAQVIDNVEDDQR